ncbi:MAG: phage portal protein [Solobacterium sp.]|nr:phage portal protein [Solobacterium sp.]
MVKVKGDIVHAIGLPEEEAKRLAELMNVFNKHAEPNKVKAKYYEGHITLDEVNLGIALPTGLAKLEIGCAWGEKAVDVLASRSMFDGFVTSSGTDSEKMNQIAKDNRLIAEYMKACRDELKYGCTFATLSADDRIGARIRFHSPQTAAALWSGEKQRIDCGFAIIDSEQDNSTKGWYPSLVNYYTDTAIWTLQREGNVWYATEYPHRLGRSLMEPLIWNATSAKPFGRSRLKEPIRRLIQGYVRTVANATIGLEFATSPQKYLLGVTDDQYDQITSSKFQQYVGSILASTQNPETGQNPVFGQLSQGTIEPHVQMLRLLATQFSAATGLTVTDTGVINDANPTSSDAILAQSQTLVLMAEQLNAGNGDALYSIAQMALAISQNVTLDELSDEDKAVMAHFKNPAMPSLASTADAAVKIASARQAFSDTDVFAEMIGFDQADIRRIKAQETKVRGLQTLSEEFGNDLEG